MKDHKVSSQQRWARFRLQVIGPLLASPAESGELQSEIRILAERIYQHPLHHGKSIQLGFSTIERWYYQAKYVADPIASLSRKVRSDAGRRLALSETLLAALEAQYAQHPRWTVQLHYDNLAAEVAEKPDLGVLPSYQSVRRRMLEKGWLRRREPANPTEGQRRAAQRRHSREVRGFEVSHVHALWHLDFHQGSLKVLDEAGRWHTAMVCAVIDDRSRLCCHLQWYLAETAQNLIHALSQAMLKRGLPRALMTDNGAAMLAEETREGLTRLGVNHETTLPYSAYQNGKQEVFWAQLEGRLMELLRGGESLRLEFLNRVSQAWVEQDYHRRTHSEIGCTPLDCMLAGPEVSRPAPDLESLQLTFTRQITRAQRRSDATVTVDGVRFEIPSRFRHFSRLTLRYASWDLSRLVLVDPDRDTPLARLLPQDKQHNASGHRKSLEPVAAALVRTPAPGKQLPALVRKWLAEYAATGIPPAYLPSQEDCHER
jgi:transposase InsO family protein